MQNTAKQNYPVQSLLMTFGQETSPRGDPWHRKQVIRQVHTTVNLCQCRNNMSREKMTHHVPNNADRSFTVTLTSKQGKQESRAAARKPRDAASVLFR